MFVVALTVGVVGWVYFQFETVPSGSSSALMVPFIGKSNGSSVEKKGWGSVSASPFGSGPAVVDLPTEEDVPATPEFAALLAFYETADKVLCASQKEYETSMGVTSAETERCRNLTAEELQAAEDALRERAAQGHLDAALQIAQRGLHKHLLIKEAQAKQELEAYEKDGTLPARYSRVASELGIPSASPPEVSAFSEEQTTLISQLRKHMASGDPDVFRSLARIYESRSELPDNELDAMAFDTLYRMRGVSNPKSRITNELLEDIPDHQRGA